LTRRTRRASLSVVLGGLCPPSGEETRGTRGRRRWMGGLRKSEPRAESTRMRGLGEGRSNCWGWFGISLPMLERKNLGGEHPVESRREEKKGALGGRKQDRSNPLQRLKCHTAEITRGNEVCESETSLLRGEKPAIQETPKQPNHAEKATYSVERARRALPQDSTWGRKDCVSVRKHGFQEGTGKGKITSDTLKEGP